MQSLRQYIMDYLAPYVRIEVWEQPVSRAAETAAWLGLASLYHEGWEQPAKTTADCAEGKQA